VRTKSLLLSNLISLLLLQGGLYLLPLIIVPYQVRVIGVEYFGVIALARSISAYIGVFVDYGFNYVGARKVAVYKDDKNRLNEIFMSVLYSKMLLAIIGLLVIFCVSLLIPNLREYYWVYLISYLYVIGQALFPNWFYMGIEKNKNITVIILIARIVFVVCVFVFIRKPEDFYKIPLFNSVTMVLAGAISLQMIFNHFDFKIKSINILDIRENLKEGSGYYITNMASSSYSFLAPFFLGVFYGNSVVGYYSGGEKIILAFKNLIHPIGYAINPIQARIYKQSKRNGLQYLKNKTIMFGLIMLVMCFLLMIYADKVVFVVLGENFDGSVVWVKMLSFVPFLALISNLLGYHGLYYVGYKKYLTYYYVLAAIIAFVFMLILMGYNAYFAVSISVLFYEFSIVLFVVFVFVYVLKNRAY